MGSDIHDHILFFGDTNLYQHYEMDKHVGKNKL